MYEYAAKLIRVIDGETVELSVELGFNVTVRERFRLSNVAVPSMTSSDQDERNRASVARIALTNLVRDQSLIISMDADERGPDGLYRCRLRTPQGTVNDMLVATGHAKLSHVGSR